MPRPQPSSLSLALLLLVAAVVALGPLAGCAKPEPEAEAEQKVAATFKLPMTTESDEARKSFYAGLDARDMGRFTEATEHMRAASAADPAWALGHLYAALSANSIEEFSNHLAAARANAAGATEAELAFIASVEKSFANDFEGQLAEAEKLAALAPESPRAWLQVASSQASLGRYEDERATARKVIETYPDFVPAYGVLVNSYLFNEPRDFAQAEEAARKIVELAADEQYSHDLLGDVHRAQGKLEAAHADYSRAIELAPDDGSPYQQRGHVNSFLGNYDEARADYQKAMDLSEPTIAAQYAIWKALVSVHAGDSPAAVAELEELVAAVDGMNVDKPKSAKIVALNNLATIATHHGMADEARGAIDRCRALMDERALEVGKEEFARSQKAQLAYQEGMLAARTGDYAGAAVRAEEFMKLVEPNVDPRKNEPAHEIQGYAALLQGDYAAAVGHYEQTDPANIYARYNHGLALEGAGRAEEAQAVFDDVAAHNFNFAGYALIRKDVMAKASAPTS